MRSTSASRARPAHRLCAGLACAAVLSGCVDREADAPAADDRATSRADAGTDVLATPPRPWMAVNMAGPDALDLQDWAALAGTTDLVVANSWKLPAEVASAMHAADPPVRTFVYLNGTFAQKDEGSTFPDDWYARDAAGQQVRSRGYGNLMMNPRHPGWRAHVATRCASLVAEGAWTGCYLDVLGPAPVSRSYVTSPALDPDTGRTWTGEDWMQATTALADHVARANPSHSIIGNGLGNGDRYWDTTAPTRRLLDSLELAVAEIWLRTPRDGHDAFPDAESWRRSIDMVADAEERGRGVLAMVRLPTGLPGSVVDQWYEYALASFLLGAGERSRLAFHGGLEGADALAQHLAPELGRPTGSAEHDHPPGGMSIRHFELGMVVVNPTHVERMFTLDRPHRLLDGTRVESTVVVPPNTGLVLHATR